METENPTTPPPSSSSPIHQQIISIPPHQTVESPPSSSQNNIQNTSPIPSFPLNLPLVSLIKYKLHTNNNKFDVHQNLLFKYIIKQITSIRWRDELHTFSYKFDELQNNLKFVNKYLLPPVSEHNRENAYKLGWIPIYIKLHQIFTQIICQSTCDEEVEGGAEALCSNAGDTVAMWNTIKLLNIPNNIDEIETEEDPKGSITLPFTIHFEIKVGCWNYLNDDEVTDKQCCFYDASNHSMTLNVDPEIVGFACQCLGRYDTYLLALILAAMKTVCTEEEVAPHIRVPRILKRSFKMAAIRARHALRVYNEVDDRWRISSAKYEWYLTFLTSGSVNAVLDIMKDLDTEVWYAQFNKYDHSSHKRLETLLVALLGHSYGPIRERAVVLLNCFYDQHCWQKEVLTPVVTVNGSPFTVEIPATSTEKVDGAPPGMSDSLLILSAPSTNVHFKKTVYSVHRIQWQCTSQETTNGKSKYVWKGTVKFENFWRCGFFDWRVVCADEEDGTWIPVQVSREEINDRIAALRKPFMKDAANTPSVEDALISSTSLQGRFIVQPRGLSEEQLHEVFIDQLDARWKEDTGELVQRGSFGSIKESLERFHTHGITTIYLMGALSRDNGDVLYTNHGDLTYERPDASPFAVTCRATPNAMLGGIAGFRDLMREAKRLNLKIIVDSLARISSSRPHRKYWNLILYALDDDGKRRMLYGTDGRSMSYEDSAVLNYRSVKAWDLIVQDVMYWANQMGVDGIRLDNAQSWPLILPVNDKELNRIDTDGQNHYTSEQKLFGTIVKPLTGEECGYWETEASMTLPNPLLVKLCKEMWRLYPNFVVYGECWGGQGFEGRAAVLARSGVVPQMQNLPNTLCKVLGREINSDGHVIPLNPPASIHVLNEWYELCHADLPQGALIVQSSCSHSSPLPGLLYGRGAWLAVDLLLLLPDIPSTFAGEMEGMAFRLDVTNVYQTNEASKVHAIGRRMSQLKSDPYSISSRMSSARSLVNLSEVTTLGEADKNEKPVFEKRISAIWNESSDTPALLSRVRSLNKLEHVSNLANLEEEHLRVLGPNFGFDLKRIKGHYDHRRLLRRVYKTFRVGNFIPLAAVGSDNKLLQNVFAFARCCAEDGEFAIVALNMGSESIEEVRISLSNLENSFKSVISKLKGILVSFDILKTNMRGVCESELIYEAFDEVFTEPLCFRLKGYATFCRGYRSADEGSDPAAVKMKLYECSIKRLSGLIRQMNAHMLYSLSDHSTKEIIRRNYVFSSLLQCLQDDSNDESLSSFLQCLYEIEKQYTLTAGEKSSLSLLAVCVNSGFFTDDEDLASRLIAKMELISSYKEGSGAVLMAQEFVRQNDIGAIVFVTPELGKWSTVGGLGVMVDELSATLAQNFDQDLWVISPYYDKSRNGETGYLLRDSITHSFNMDIHIGNELFTFGVHTGCVKNVNLVFLHNPRLFPHAYPDFLGADIVRLLVAIAKGSLEVLCQLRCIPQLIVTNDWMTALTAAYAKKGFFGNVFDDTTFFHIVHNLDPTYEGRIYPTRKDDMSWIHNLPGDLLVDPYWQQYVINPSRCALLQCDSWGTVSPSYRDDLRGITGHNPSPLAPLLNRHRSPFAFPNGISVQSRLARIRGLEFHDHWEAKGALQKLYFGFELPDLSIPLFAFIGRITAQKGIHLILDAAENIVRHYEGRVQIIIGGKADRRDSYSQRCAHRMRDLCKNYPWSIWASPDEFFNNGAHVNFGADFGLMPSAFEPGGIVQQEFFVAGTPVIAFYTGGLKDTVFEFNLETNTGNGFVFESYTSGDFLYAMERALRIFRDTRKYGLLRKNAFESVVSCEDVAKAWLKEFYMQRNKIFSVPSKVRRRVEWLRQNKIALTSETASTTSEKTSDECKRLSTVSSTRKGPIPTAAPVVAEKTDEKKINLNTLNDVPADRIFPAEPSQTNSPFSRSTNPIQFQSNSPEKLFVEPETPTHSALYGAQVMQPLIDNAEGQNVLHCKGQAEAIIPYRIRYSSFGKVRPRSVALAGSFDDWSVRRPLLWDNALQAFVITVSPKPGTYRYKLIVDGDWVCNPVDDTEMDSMGNWNNIIVI